MRYFNILLLLCFFVLCIPSFSLRTRVSHSTYTLQSLENEINNEIDIDSDADIDTDVDVDIQTEAEIESENENENVIQTETETETELDTEIDSDVELDTETEVETEISHKAKNKVTWGHTGHFMIGELANRLLTPTTKAAITKAIGKNQTLASIANWADEIAYNNSWSKSLHFINAKDGSCTYVRDATCKFPAFCSNVDGAIQNYTHQLINNGPKSAIVQQQSIQFLTHFIGDIHQPLHVGNTGDRGGNSINVTFNGIPSTLHIVWDVYLIERMIQKQYKNNTQAFLQYMVNAINDKNGQFGKSIKSWLECDKSAVQTIPGTKRIVPSCSDKWAKETAKIACDLAYKQGTTIVKSGAVLNDQYYDKTIGTVQTQLAKAAVRLAAVLNTALDAKYSLSSKVTATGGATGVAGTVKASTTKPFNISSVGRGLVSKLAQKISTPPIKKPVKSAVGTGFVQQKGKKL